MPNNYILKNKNGQILNFYYLGDCIYYSKYEKSGFTNPKKVISNIESNFTVDFYKNGEVYIISQKLNGEIILSKEEGQGFVHKSIFKLNFNHSHKAFFKTILNSTDITLIYNIPSKSSKEQILVKNQIGYENSWADSLNIDYFTPFNFCPFKVQKIADDHMIILYLKRDRENILGYREISKNKTTSFNIFLKTPGQIIDQSFLATKDCIHFLYVVKNLFSSQVIYRRRDGNGFSKPILLKEGAKIRSCSLSIINGVLYAFWGISSSLFYLTSNDNGNSFNNKYVVQICPNSTKAEFISFDKVYNEKLILNEVFVDYNDFSNIQFFKEIYPEFFEENIKNSLAPSLQDNFLINFQNIDEKKGGRLTVFKPDLSGKNEFDEFLNFNEFNYKNTSKKTQVSNLKTKVNLLQNSLEEKNNKIQELNEIIKVQTDENVFLQQKVEDIKEENIKIKENFTFREDDGGEEVEDVEVKEEES